MEKPIIYACSDSLGETAERVARAAASQYDKQEFNIIRVPYIRSEQQIEELVCKAEANKAMICYTIISPSAPEAAGTDQDGQRYRRRHHRPHAGRCRHLDRYGTDVEAA